MPFACERHAEIVLRVDVDARAVLRAGILPLSVALRWIMTAPELPEQSSRVVKHHRALGVARFPRARSVRGLRVFPAMYPTAVADTLGSLQKPLSDPQKQPVAGNLRRPAGNTSSGDTHAGGGARPARGSTRPAARSAPRSRRKSRTPAPLRAPPRCPCRVLYLAETTSETLLSTLLCDESEKTAFSLFCSHALGGPPARALSSYTH